MTPALVPFVWDRVRALRMYAGLLLLLTLLAVFFFWNRIPQWAPGQAWFPHGQLVSAFLTQSPKLIAAFILIIPVAACGYSRREYFLTGGEWAGSGWVVLGIGLAAAMSVVVLAYLQATDPGGKGRLVVAALLLAAMNAFAEEVIYRGALLAPLLRCFSSDQAVAMTAALFGIGHYYGTPSGLPGIGLTFLAGLLFGRAMVGTLGLVLPWFLHFVPDAVIYISSVQGN